MGDDGEIADFGEISHAQAYDLESEIGQEGTANLGYSFEEELLKFRSLDSKQRGTMTGRVFLRALSLFERNTSPAISDEVTLNCLKLILSIWTSQSDHSPDDRLCCTNRFLRGLPLSPDG
ncbi:hypothetical protein, partial [Phaeobacter sp. CECT 5382]|uniref:hypothetical protein n=1 Tax=Phaeobacter sp. CECT 5382 TaxID=1712645 RepID=UPI001E5C3864